MIASSTPSVAVRERSGWAWMSGAYVDVEEVVSMSPAADLLEAFWEDGRAQVHGELWRIFAIK